MESSFDFEKQLKFFELLEAVIAKKVEAALSEPTDEPYESEKTDEISAALAVSQGEFLVVRNNRTNPYFSTEYGDLDQIMKAIRPSLVKNGISLTQQLKFNDGAMILATRIRHNSGQWIETRARILPSKNDDQTFASALMFMKRHSVATLVGITIPDDTYDDDAEVQMIGARNIIAKGPSNKYNPREQSFEPIGKDQLEELECELAEYPHIAEEVLDKMKIQSLADLPKSRFKVSIARVRAIKYALENSDQKKQ